MNLRRLIPRRHLPRGVWLRSYADPERHEAAALLYAIEESARVALVAEEPPPSSRPMPLVRSR